MSDATTAFTEHLVRRFPQLEPGFREHVSDFGEVLPHLFVADVERYATARYLEWGRAPMEAKAAIEQELRSILATLEAAFSNDDELDELLSVSSLEHLPRPHEEAAGLRTWVGPNMAVQLRALG